LKRPTLLLVALLPCVAIAALAPVHQNPKDLSAMVAFVLSHAAVIQSLRTIDFENRTVHFGKDCVAKFGRAEGAIRPGPAAPLEFKSSNCPVGQTK
jgi:hypothetical protein